MRLTLSCIFIPLSMTAFAGENLLPNGDFRDGLNGWQVGIKASDGRAFGTVDILSGYAPGGAPCLHYQKTIAASSSPSVFTRPLTAKPETFYEFSMLVKAGAEFQLRYTLWSSKNGDSADKHSFYQPAGSAWRRARMKVYLPPGIDRLAVGFNMYNQTGELFVADAQLVEMPRDKAFLRMTRSADRIHNLVELSQRTRLKPFNRLTSQNADLPGERVVFKDTATGATIWKMSRNPGYNRHHYSNMPVWNTDGSELMLKSNRGDRSGYWLVAADGSRWHYFGPSFSQWSRQNQPTTVRSTNLTQ